MSRTRNVFSLFVVLLVAVLALLPAKIRATDEVHWSPLGPGGGGNSFAWGVSPLDPNIVLVGGDVGGIFRSSDGGVTWSHKNLINIRPNHAANGYSIGGHFTFDPINQNVVYLGMLKSTDAGNTWSVNVEEDDGAGPTAVDPVSPNIVYASSYANVYRSTDGFGGQTCTGSHARLDDPTHPMQCESAGIACRPGMRCYQRGCYPDTPTASAAGCINYNMRTNALVVNPVGAGSLSSSQLLACTNLGFFNSTDSGTTWNRLPNTSSGIPSGMAGLCSGGTKQGSSCLTDGECPGGTCVAAICGGSNNVCSVDADCRPNLGDTQVCTNGRCAGSGVQCWKPGDCTQGQVCSGLSCASMTMANDANHTLYAAMTTRVVGADPGGSAQDPWIDIDKWQGGIYKSTNFGSTWTPVNGLGNGQEYLPYPDKNPGFEDPLGTPGPNHFAWVIATSDQSYVARDCTVGHNSTCSIKMTYPQSVCVGGSNNGNNCSVDTDCPPSGTGYCALVHAISTPDPSDQVNNPTSSLLQITGGTLYKLRAWYKTSAATRYPSYSKIWWYKSDRTPLLWAGKPNNYYSLEPWVEDFPVGSPHTYDWRKFETLVRAPDQAMYAKIEFRAGVGTAVWIDDVSFQATQDLPRISGRGEAPYFASYSDVATIPGPGGNVLYASTQPSTTNGLDGTDTTGIWRSDDGGDHWNLMTRARWHDNVVDNSRYEPVPRDGVCGGRWETCSTSPGDCNRNVCSGGSNNGFLCASAADCPAPGTCGAPSFCCGDATCSTALGENRYNCPVDCYDTGDHDPVRTGQNENCSAIYGGVSYATTHCNSMQQTTWGLAIGLPQGGVVPNNVVIYTGNQHLKSADGGTTWQDMTSTAYTSPPGEEPGSGTYQGKGANDVYTYFVVKDSRVNRLYNGDTDNQLMVSHNNGTSFTTEGWQWSGNYSIPQDSTSPLLNGDAATSMALDPNDPNTIYVGVATGAGSIQKVNSDKSGVVKGTYHPKSGSVAGFWSWSRLGTFADTGGGIDLVRDPVGNLFAAYYSHGVFKLPAGSNAGTAWTNTFTGSNWNPAPVNWKTYRLRQETVTGRLYMGAGDPMYLSSYTIPAGETGVWEWYDSGNSWCRISTADVNPPYGMDMEAVQDLVPMGPDGLLVATSVVTPGAADAAGNYTGKGGIWKGMRLGDCNWAWTQVLKQPKVTGLAVSPTDRSTIYAFAGQGRSGGPILIPGQKAGIYRSDDEGVTWYAVTNDGLGNLSHGALNMSDTDPNTIYASTLGDGSFVGTRSCTNPIVEGGGTNAQTCFDGVDNDCDGVVDFNCSMDATNQAIVGGAGVLVSGTIAALKGRPDKDVLEVFKEKNLGSTKPLDVVWTFTPTPTNNTYYLNVEGFKASDANDTFTFKSTTRASGICDGTESGYTSRVTLSNTTTYDNDKAAFASIGTVTSGFPVVCIRLVDGGLSDSHQDTVSLDRVYLFPAPVEVVAVSDQTVIGSKSGTYSNTANSDNVREAITEILDITVSPSVSRLEHIWRFDAVPIAASHQLNVEGYRIAGSDNPVDNFQFSYSTDGVNFSDISSAIISNSVEAPGGVYYTFGSAGIGGTIYIRVKDTNQTSGTSLDSVNIDRLAIKTIP
jgi:hypothetical protein